MTRQIAVEIREILRLSRYEPMSTSLPASLVKFEKVKAPLLSVKEYQITMRSGTTTNTAIHRV